MLRVVKIASWCGIHSMGLRLSSYLGITGITLAGNVIAGAVNQQAEQLSLYLSLIRSLDAGVLVPKTLIPSALVL